MLLLLLLLPLDPLRRFDTRRFLVVKVRLDVIIMVWITFGGVMYYTQDERIGMV